MWQGIYLDPSVKVYNFLISLVEQALKQPNILPLGDLFRSLNRTILFQLSIVPTSEKDQKALMETLCSYSGQAHTIFDDTNVDSEFLECVTYRLLQIMFSDSRAGGAVGRSEDGVEGGGAGRERWNSSYQPMAQSVMKSGANRLWQKILEMKHDALQVKCHRPQYKCNSFVVEFHECRHCRAYCQLNCRYQPQHQLLSFQSSTLVRTYTVEECTYTSMKFLILRMHSHSFCITAFLILQCPSVSSPQLPRLPTLTSLLPPHPPPAFPPLPVLPVPTPCSSDCRGARHS